MFSGRGWRDENFNPKYAMKPTHAEGMFRHSNIKYGLYNHKDKFDFSNCTILQQLIGYSSIMAIGAVDTRKTTNAADLNYFAYANYNLHTIDKLILKTDGSQTFTNLVTHAPLKEITFEGVIGNTITFPSAIALSRRSILGTEITEEEYALLSTDVRTYNVIEFDGKKYYGGIIAALSATKDGQTITFRKVAKEAAFTTEEWDALIALRSNWTFNLT